MTRPFLFPWDAQIYGASAAVAWYDREILLDPTRNGVTRDRAESWWQRNVAVGEGWAANSMPRAADEAQVAAARAHYDEVVRDTLRDVHASWREDWFMGDRPGLSTGH